MKNLSHLLGSSCSLGLPDCGISKMIYRDSFLMSVDQVDEKKDEDVYILVKKIVTIQKVTHL